MSVNRLNDVSTRSRFMHKDPVQRRIKLWLTLKPTGLQSMYLLFKAVVLNDTV